MEMFKPTHILSGKSPDGTEWERSVTLIRGGKSPKDFYFMDMADNGVDYWWELDGDGKIYFNHPLATVEQPDCKIREI